LNFKNKYLELLVWAAGLVFLALQNPFLPSPSICVIHYLLPGVCPGCGLGTSISFLLDGYVIESVKTHILGIPVAIILLGRIATLMQNLFFKPRTPAILILKK